MNANGTPDECDPHFIRGDVNGDGKVPAEPTDIIYYASWAFLGQDPPPCMAAADVNGDAFVGGGTDDIIYLAQFLFLGQAPPCELVWEILENLGRKDRAARFRYRNRSDSLSATSDSFLIA